MPKRDELLRKLDNLEQLNPFMAKFSGETDRACAILAGVLLDGLLENLLRKNMLPSTTNELFSGYGPLSSFSAKIDVSYYFGLISRGEHTELHRIRRIRNEFAHSLDASLSFSTQPISDHVAELQLSRSSIVKKETPRRTDFVTSILVLTGFLQGAMQRTTAPKQLEDPVESLLRGGINPRKLKKETYRD